jgi:hypothetical protein
MRTVYLSVLPEDLEEPSYAPLRAALERARAAGADVIATPGAPVSVRADDATLADVLAALGAR